MINKKKNFQLVILALVLVSLNGCRISGDKNIENKSVTIANVEETNSLLQYIEKEEEYQISLKKELIDSVDKISYTIVGKDEYGFYPVLYGREPMMNDDRVVYIPKKQSVPMLYFEATNESLPLRSIKEEKALDEIKWNSFITVKDDTIYSSYNKNIEITWDQSHTTDKLTYRLFSEETGIKNPLIEEIASEYWGRIGVSKKYIKTIYNENGEIVPSNQWQFDSYEMYDYQYPNILKGGLDIRLVELNEFKGEYYCQLVLELKDETSIASDLMLLHENPGNPYLLSVEDEPYKEITEYTEKGDFLFHVYKEYAVLKKYTGEDTFVAIPEKVEGKPVTVIGSNAFFNNETLRNIKFPKTIEKIENFAFGDTVLQEITLPENLEYIGYMAFGSHGVYRYDGTVDEISTVYIGKKVKWIGDGAFSGYYVKEFEVVQENPYYQDIEGSIYTKDLEFLIACPTGKNGDFIVPDKVTGIASDAFLNNGGYSKLLQDAKGIEKLVLADTVTTFSTSSLPESLTMLVVGKELKNWESISECTGAFEIVVSDENPYFRIENGMILDAEKKELYKCLSTISESVLELPESITKIHQGAFYEVSAVFNVFIPSKLELVGMNESDISNIFNQFPNLMNIQVAEDNKRFCSQDGVLFTKDMSVLLSYPNAKKQKKYAIPQGVSAVSMYAFDLNKELESIHLPASLQKLKLFEEYRGFLDYITQLSDITVSEENPYIKASSTFLYCIEDGTILFSNDNYESQSVHIPEGVKIITQGIFDYISYDCIAEEFYFPEGVSTIEGDNFNNITQDDEWDIIDIYLPDTVTEISDDSFENSSGIVIHAHKDSYAAQFAYSKGIPFEEIIE